MRFVEWTRPVRIVELLSGCEALLVDEVLDAVAEVRRHGHDVGTDGRRERRPVRVHLGEERTRVRFETAGEDRRHADETRCTSEDFLKDSPRIAEPPGSELRLCDL